MTSTACVSDLRLDELLAGEPVAAGTETHLASCAACQARRDELAAERERYRAAPPPLPRLRRARAPWLVGAGIAAAAAAVVVLAAAPRTGGEGGSGGEGGEPAVSGTRTKGGARLGFVVVHGGAMRTGGPGERVHPGDTLAFAVSTPRPAYVAVLGREPGGRTTVYFPAGPAGARAARIEAGLEQQLPLATVLDDTLGAELLIAAFCDRPISLDELRTATVMPPPGCTVDTAAIEKLR